MTDSPQNPNAPHPLLSIEELSIEFPSSDQTPSWVHAVDQLSLKIFPGEIVGLVGESGCGKSLTSLSILKLVPPPGRIDSKSQLWFRSSPEKAVDLTKLSNDAIRNIRGAEIAMIPQDPMTSLNPVYTVGDQLLEILHRHQPGLSQQAAKQKALALLDQVRIPNAKDRLNEYPHQFSGGMRQRVMIAMALSCNPKLLIADEPTTALDVTVQAQILDLMRSLQQEHNMAILLITHDLGVVAEMCHRVAVMYAGQIIEEAPVNQLFASPKHPYTQGLLHSLPNLELDSSGDKRRLSPIEGQPPSIYKMPPGCRFEPRCAKRLAHCVEASPNSQVVDTNQTTRCYLYA